MLVPAFSLLCLAANPYCFLDNLVNSPNKYPTLVVARQNDFPTSSTKFLTSLSLLALAKGLSDYEVPRLKMIAKCIMNNKYKCEYSMKLEREL